MQTIYIDIANKGVIPTINAKQGDAGKKFEICFSDSGVQYQIPNGAAFSAFYSGASGEGNYTDIGQRSAFTINGNSVVVEMIEQMLVNHGDGVLCLVLGIPDGASIGTWNIPYQVEFVPGLHSEEATQYYTAFSEAVKNLPYPDSTLSAANKAADAAAVGAALAGKAPAGYGLGGTAVRTEDWNTTYDNGFYYGITNSPDGSWWYGYVVRDGADASRITQTIYRDGIICTRTGTTTDMGVWEYINTPMIPGVEYRTTERYNGKPVYVKLIDVGDLPSNDTKTIYHEISVDRPLNIILTAEDAVLNWHPWFDQVRFEKSVLYIVTNNASASIYTGAQCRLKYTKT